MQKQTFAAEQSNLISFLCWLNHRNMSRTKDDAGIVTPTKKLRFRGELNFHSRVDEIFDDENKRNSGAGSSAKGINAKQNGEDKEHRKKGEWALVLFRANKWWFLCFKSDKLFFIVHRRITIIYGLFQG